MGRLFTPDECRKGGRAAALLSYEFWQRQFGGDPAIVGRTITINAAPADITGPVTVVGVLPAWFDFGAIFSPGDAGRFLRAGLHGFLAHLGQYAGGCRPAETWHFPGSRRRRSPISCFRNSRPPTATGGRTTNRRFPPCRTG